MDVRALKDKAAQLFTKGKFAKAAETYDEYCRADPKDLQARLRLGDAWIKAGKKDKAILAYTWAAEGFAREGFLPRAIAASKLVLEVDPSHTGVQKMLADLYAQKSKPTSRASSVPPSSSSGVRAAPPPPPQGQDARALELEAPPRPAARARPVEAPSPMNRKDAIEVGAFEIPVDDGRAGVGGMAAVKGPSPLTRSDAIEIEVEAEAPRERSPEAAAPIEIELAPSGPVTGEVEIPIEAAADQLPAELQVPVLQGQALAEPPVVPGEALPPAPPPAPVYELTDEVSAPEPSAPVYELDVEVPEPPPEVRAPPPTAEPPRVAAAAPPSVPVVPPVAPPAIAPVADVRDAPPPLPLPAVEESDAEGLVLTPAPRPVEVPPPPPEVIPPAGKPSEPPGLKPRRVEPPPPFQSTPSGSRIWLPPGFGPGAAASSDAPPAAAAPREGVSDLERSLQAFTQVEAEAASAPAPRAAVGGFTELELEGDSLLHTVDAAATRGLAERGAAPPAPVREESMEAPDEGRAEPGALPKIPLFSDLPPDAFIALFEKCPLRRFEPGQLVLEQGSKGDAFYVICAGSVRVVRTDGAGTRELAKLDEGAFFGEMALLSEAPRSASVEATDEETQLLEISAGVLKELSAKHPSVSSALKKFCRQRLLSNLMQSSALFQPFSKSDRRDLVQKFRARDVRKGEAVIKEGQSSDGLYVVLSGEVEVTVKGKPVAKLREGDVFGEMSLLTRTPATATVTSARHTSLLRLPREDFDRLIMSHPQILAHVSELTDERAKANAAAQMV